MSVVIYECPHDETKIRRKQIAGGGFQIKPQCLRCGRSVGNPIAKANAPVVVEDWDVELEARGEEMSSQVWRERANLRDQELRDKDAAWWQRYNNYLCSPEWKSKRRLVLERDGYLCQACLVNRAVEVHHLSYKHIFAEPLFELTSVCKPCHDGITSRDRSPEYVPAAVQGVKP